MSSLRSDTLTMRVTGVRITVFCSAIVIDVIVHCHTAGALLSQTAENNCPYHRVVGFLILSGQFKITPYFPLGCAAHCVLSTRRRGGLCPPFVCARFSRAGSPKGMEWGK